MKYKPAQTVIKIYRKNTQKLKPYMRNPTIESQFLN